MGLRNNLKICGAYLIYLFTLLWMLTKEFLGYPVDWSQCPPLPTSGLQKCEPEAEGHSVVPGPRYGSLEKGKDLEANLGPTKSARSGDSGEDVLGSSEKLAKRKSRSEYDADNFVIYQTSPTARETTDLPPEPQAQSPPAQSEPQGQLQTQEIKASDTPNTGCNQPTNSQLAGKPNHTKVKPDPLIDVLNDALHDHQKLEDATVNRLNFVKGLKYTENRNFKFPALLSVLRIRSARFKHSLQRNAIASALIHSATPTPNTSTLCHPLPAITDTPTTIAPTTPVPLPQSPPPLTRFPTSTSSSSSYSSSYTITSATYSDLPTPVDEDVPIKFTSLPSWRRDPEHAKFVFGSLARSHLNADIGHSASDGFVSPLNGVAAVMVDSGARVEGITSSHEAEEENGSKSPGFENMIIAMGLTPRSGVPAAQSMSSIKSWVNLAATGKATDSVRIGILCDGEDEADGASMLAMKSRKSIMSDVLSWVGSSSSIVA